ncbi:MAG: excisionase family DNA-binding protein [Actinobacteria bacterium]|nr:excisionase family DNA-binding protein [Actinomycetota bacterium]MCA1722225.1 excisionase family DNA-binding protein [Actinomycetota bacterium]
MTARDTAAHLAAHATRPTLASKNYETIAEAALRLGVSARTIRRRIADGHLRAYRFGPRLIRLDAGEVDAVLRRIPAA